MARIQDAPQSTTYTKKADKKKTAKPVGYRFTDKKADKLGKKSTSKPSASEIEKFLGKDVYKEKRADKSDIKPKDKFAKGGQASPQSGSYTESMPKGVKHLLIRKHTSETNGQRKPIKRKKENVLDIAIPIN